MTSRSKVKFFHDFREFESEIPATYRGGTGYRNDDGWHGGSYKSALDMLKQGNSKSLEKADALLEKLDTAIELEAPSWEHDLVGFIPCVPSYLAGSPMSMKRQVPVARETTPMKIAVSVTCGANYSAEQIAARGIACLALARKLAEIRPLELWVFSDQDGEVPCIRLDTLPMDLSKVSAIIGHGSFFRNTLFSWGYENRGFSGGWADFGKHYFRGSPEYVKALRENLGLADQDLLIEGGYNQNIEEVTADPVKWVNDQVRKYASLVADE